MTYEHPGDGGLDYMTCRYGTSRVLFRGPRQKLIPPYTVFFGGTETYGRFVRDPFPAIVAKRTGLRCINMGCMNAGPDVFACDADLLAVAARADTVVLQLAGAHNLSNRFYSVHPRRNDRFLAPSALLRKLYPEVDFTEFSFTRHLLGTLEEICPARFAQVVEELQACWLKRVKLILREAGPKVILLWLSDGPPPAEATSFSQGRDPALVDIAMVAQVAAQATTLVEVRRTPACQTDATAGMIHTEFEAAIAAETIGPAVHERIAKAILPPIWDLSAAQTGAEGA